MDRRSAGRIGAGWMTAAVALATVALAVAPLVSSQAQIRARTPPRARVPSRAEGRRPARREGQRQGEGEGKSRARLVSLSAQAPRRARRHADGRVLSRQARHIHAGRVVDP